MENLVSWPVGGSASRIGLLGAGSGNRDLALNKPALREIFSPSSPNQLGEVKSLGILAIRADAVEPACVVTPYPFPEGVSAPVIQ